MEDQEGTSAATTNANSSRELNAGNCVYTYLQYVRTCIVHRVYNNH